MKPYKRLFEDEYTQWYITKYDSDGNNKKLYSFSKFDKNKIQYIFDLEAKKL